jgi:hypothetical protein
MGCGAESTVGLSYPTARGPALSATKRSRWPGAFSQRPKQYLRRKVDLTVDHDREIRLLQAALRDKGTNLTYSQIIEKMIDDFLEKLGTG